MSAQRLQVGQFSVGVNTLAVAGVAEPLNALQDKMQAALVEGGMSPEAARMTAQAVAQASAVGIGSLVGGAAGGTTALAVDTNNRQMHPIEKQIIGDVLAKDYAAKHPGMSVAQAEQVLDSQLLRQVDDTAGAAGGFDQDAANYLNAYKYAHTGVSVGKDQWGNSVPIFGTSAGYQRTDSTIFSGQPQTTKPPTALTPGTMFNYFKTASAELVERVWYFGDLVLDVKSGIVDMFSDPFGSLAKSQAGSRYILNQAGQGNFDPAAKIAGQQIGETLVGTAVGLGTGAIIKSSSSFFGSSWKTESAIASGTMNIQDTNFFGPAPQSPSLAVKSRLVINAFDE